MNAPAKNLIATPDTTSTLPRDPVVLPVEAYIDKAYAAAERDKLWAKVWQAACREEEIAEVGDYVIYDILDQSVIVTRSSPDTISAYHNVCMHRGRRLANGCGHTGRFTCRFHGWQWDLQGENVHALDRKDWGEALTGDNLRLGRVKVGTWGGYVFINFDADAEPLEAYLQPLQAWLDPFEIDKMRYRWRQWLHFPCNWKVALEAFIESYHVPGTHPQLLSYGRNTTWTRAHGRHSCTGIGGSAAGTSSVKAKAGTDARKLAYEFQAHLLETVNANTTETIVNAARQLVDVLPEDTPAEAIGAKMMELAAQADAERGVPWPVIDPDHFRESGITWHVFPNTVILHGISFILGYRARPNGTDPNSCIFEVYVLERFPDGQEPKPENVYEPDISEEKWRLVLAQDFINMSEVQAGMKSWGFPGPRPSPWQEQSIINFHTNLAEYMGTGAPQTIG